MNTRQNFDTQYVDERLDAVADKIDSTTTIYVAGGAVMAAEDLKEGTKDIDVIVENVTEFNTLRNALEALGYARPGRKLEIVYQRMHARAILQNTDGFRWDIFETVVASKFHLSSGMKSRAKTYKEFRKKLSVKFLSLEDIFLMKSVTGREGDLQDMAKIAEHGIDSKNILTECDWQSKKTGQIWENMVCQVLHELRKKYKVHSPVEKKICRVAEKKILEYAKRHEPS